MFSTTELVARVSTIAVKARAYKKKTGKLLVEEEEEQEATHTDPQMDIAPDPEEILDFGPDIAATSLGTCTLQQSIVLFWLWKLNKTLNDVVLLLRYPRQLATRSGTLKPAYSHFLATTPGHRLQSDARSWCNRRV